MISNMTLDARALSNRPLHATAEDAAKFVDRGGLVSKLERAFSQGLNILVLGEPGSGRTSLLRHLLWRNSAGSSSQRLVYVDGAQAESVLGVIDLVRSELSRSRTVSDAAADAFRGFGTVRAERTESAVALDWLRDLRDDDPAVILLDTVRSAEIGHTLFGTLRDELWQLPYTWVVAAQPRDQGALLEPPADAFWDVTARLGPLAPQEAREMLRARIGNDPIVEELVRVGEGNPRRQIALAREVVLEGFAPGDIHQRYAEEQLRLQELGRASHMLMSEIRSMGRPVSASDQELLQRMGWSRQRAARVLDQLQSAGFLVTYDAATQGQGRPARMYREPGDDVA
jgi:hypothetical protein